MSHGRAVIPFGKHKGTRIRLLPDAYLSWLTTTFVMNAPEWHWLKESLLAELRSRGLRADLAETPDPQDDPSENPTLEEIFLGVKKTKKYDELVTWCVVEDTFMVCRRCEARERIKVPVPLKDVCKVMLEFVQRHEHCMQQNNRRKPRDII